MVSLSDHASDALQPKAEPTPAERLAAAAEALGVTMTAVFVPFSQSRNAKPSNGAKEAWRSLNWRVTLLRNGREIIETDYAQGEGYAPAYKKTMAQIEMAARTMGRPAATARKMMIDHEIEKGTIAKGYSRGFGLSGGKPIDPPLADVLHSLTRDSDVLDYPGFEAWAAEYGYDGDSRAAEATWHACLKIALALRAAIGDAGLEALRTAGEDY